MKVIRSFANQLRESTDKFIHIPFSAYSVSPSLNSHAAQNVLQVVDDLAANMRSFSSSMHSLEGFYSPLMSDSEDSCRREIDALFSSVKQISRLARAVCSELSDALNGKKAMDLVSAILLILLGHVK